MKYAAAAVTLLSAASGVLAAPSKVARTNTTVAAASTIPYLGFIFPNVLKNHDVNSNRNDDDVQTATVRNGGIETSTLYQLPIPDNTAGKTCALVVFAGRVGNGDNILGEQAMDIFNNNIDDLAALDEGNFRNQELARIRFNPATGLYDFDAVDVVPKIQEFPCPAGKTLEWESVAVGDFDINVIQQDFSFDGVHIPNGLTIAFY
ncbi:hypothetical protein VTK73DRAFT_10314 [Phialemonium thermophilum]|uniref:Ubiquitin 3 binding protein But2 C-terminal domain-containing protein n=1 Tax=Phialemonium thermophilum TaxID=223376 RepID=A0ABR3XG68_9PEZI